MALAEGPVAAMMAKSCDRTQHGAGQYATAGRNGDHTHQCVVPHPWLARPAANPDTIAEIATLYFQKSSNYKYNLRGYDYEVVRIRPLAAR